LNTGAFSSFGGGKGRKKKEEEEEEKTWIDLSPNHLQCSFSFNAVFFYFFMFLFLKQKNTKNNRNAIRQCTLQTLQLAPGSPSTLGVPYRRYRSSI